MRHAIKVMRDAGVVNKSGGPFGAVIVKHGKVIAAAGNTVIRDNDPSAHAEVKRHPPGLPSNQKLGSQRLRDVFKL